MGWLTMLILGSGLLSLSHQQSCSVELHVDLPEPCFCKLNNVECESIRDGHIQQLQLAFAVPKVLYGFSMRQFNMSTLPLGLFGNMDATYISLNNGYLRDLRPPGARDFDSFFDGLRSTTEIRMDSVDIINPQGWEHFLREGQDTLEILYFSGPELKLTRLWDNFASRLSANLTRITVFSTGLEILESRALSCAKCIEIDLGDNHIVQLPGDLFNGSSLLENLYLRYNQLESLPDRIFEDLKNLRSLDLVGNPLRSLTDTPFQPLHNELNLLLTENAIRCSCSFQSLLRFEENLGNECLTKAGATFSWNSYLKKKCRNEN